MAAPIADLRQCNKLDGRVPVRDEGRVPRLDALAALALLIAGLAIGIDLPDIDQALPLLDHRSALTHSVLPAALIGVRWRAFGGGLALGTGVHLLADVFPNAMVGYATVKLPLLGALGPVGSYLWLGGNAVAALAFGTVVVARMPMLAAAIAALTVALSGLFYLLRTDGGWWALLLIAALTLTARRFAPR